MWAYTIRRLALLPVTLFIITITVFALMRIMPGDVVDLIMVQMTQSESRSREEVIDREMIEHALGLDQPFIVQYGTWVGGIFTRFDFGESLLSGKPVSDMILERLPVTLELSVMTMVLSFLISIPIGIYSAIRQDTLGDYAGRIFAIGMMSIPNFWIATLIIVLPSVYLGWSVPMEYIHLWVDPLQNMRFLAIPALIMGVMSTGMTMRLLRTVMLEVMRQDYVRTAWAKGLRERTIVLRHALRNAMLPVVTMFGGTLAMLFGGSVIIENIFCIPGMGRLSLQALVQRDYPIIAAINFMMSILVVVSNLVVDLSYGWLDPRVQYK
jgi:peptide/nickel transport system permease protein